MQRVDPFIHATGRSATVKPQSVKKHPPKAVFRLQKGSIDGFGLSRKPFPSQTPQQPLQASLHPRSSISLHPSKIVSKRPVASRGAVNVTPSVQQHKKTILKKERWWHKLQWPAAVLAAMVVGTFAQYLVVGYVMLGIYAAAVVVFRIKSRRTFMLALVSLAAVAFAQVLGRTQIVESFAVYTFLLFTIGTGSLILEIIWGAKLAKNPPVKS